MTLSKFRSLVNIRKSEKGAAMIEYALLVGATTLVSAASVSVFGHKTSDLYSLGASILPGAHADDNGPIRSGKLIETTVAADGPIALDVGAIAAAVDAPRLADNLGMDETDLELLVVE